MTDSSASPTSEPEDSATLATSGNAPLGRCGACADGVWSRDSFDIESQGGRNVFVHKTCRQVEA